MAVRRFALLAAVSLTFLAAPRAYAGGWQEWHQTGNDLIATFAKDGKAHVEHHVRYRVVAGKMQSFDLSAIDLDAVVVPEVSVVADDGTRLTAHAEGISSKVAKDVANGGVADPDTQVVRVTVDDPKGLKRGAYAFVVAYDVDAWKTKHLAKDGSLMRVSFTLPPSLEGRDAARAVFRLPSGPTEPRVLLRDDGSEGTDGDGTALVTLRRSPAVDEIELVRAHVSRGETITWGVRADAKAFAGKASEAEAARASKATAVAPRDRRRGAGFAVAALALGLGLGVLFGRKQRAFHLEVARAGMVPRPLLPLPAPVRPPVFALAFSGGLAISVLASPLGGTFAMLFAMLALVELRPRRVGFRVRGPGEWRPLPEAKETLGSAKEPTSPWLDATGRKGLLAFVLAVAAAFAAGALAEPLYPGVRVLAPLGALALAPLFFSGVSGQLPSTSLARSVALLTPLCHRLARRSDLRAKLYGRVLAGATRCDEARLRALPRRAMPGVRGLEVGVVEARTLTGFLPSAEVLVRVFDGSPAHARLEGLRDERLGRSVALPGRSTDEKVLRFAPSSPEPREVEGLLARLAAELHDRRGRDKKAAKPSKPYRGRERRAPIQADPGPALAV